MADNRGAIDFRLEIQAFQNICHLIHCVGCAKQTVAVFQCFRNDFFLVMIIAAHNSLFKAGRIGISCQQVDAAVHCLAGSQGVNSLGEALGCLCQQIQADACMADRNGIKVSSFNKDRICIIIDHAFFTAHDTGNTGRFPIGCNQNITVFNMEYVAIQSRHIHGHAVFDRDLSCRQTGQIVEVQRLAGFQHDEVGDINDVVNRIHAISLQILLHPGRAWSYLDMVDNLAIVNRAFLCFTADNKAAVCTTIGHAFDIRPLCLSAKNGSGFLGHVPHGRAVSSVWCQGDIQNRIVQAKIAKYIGFPNRCIGWKFFDAGELLFIQQLLTDTEFIQRTQHTVGWITMQRLGFNRAAGQFCPRQCCNDLKSLAAVWRTADNMDKLVFPFAYLCDSIMQVGAGNILAGNDLANDQIGCLGHGFNAFYFQAG